jgi:adenine phosphoribosyltransferase
MRGTWPGMETIMIDILNSLESGEKYELAVTGLDYTVALPFVIIDEGGQKLRIASLNLVGQTRLNRDFGKIIAEKIKSHIGDLEGVVLLTVVEKALQLAQVVADNLGIDAVAVAYNRIKPHMEAGRRPTIQAGVDSITSGGKFLALYERDINLLVQATKGIIIIDDVVSTGGTIFGLMNLLEEMARIKKLEEMPDILGIYCAAHEGDAPPMLQAPLTSLTGLPTPEIITE